MLLKRGMTATLEELLRSAQVIAMNGNPQIVLCERGIRTFETATRNTLDIAAVPVLKTVSHLPVIVDPSHAAGVRCLVPVLARAAVVVGADGLLVEVHPSPDKAMSDGEQSLTFRDFRDMMDDLQPYLAIRDAARRFGPQLVAAGGAVSAGAAHLRSGCSPSLSSFRRIRVHAIRALRGARFSCISFHVANSMSRSHGFAAPSDSLLTRRSSFRTRVASMWFQVSRALPIPRSRSTARGSVRRQARPQDPWQILEVSLSGGNRDASRRAKRTVFVLFTCRKTASSMRRKVAVVL